MEKYLTVTSLVIITNNNLIIPATYSVLLFSSYIFVLPSLGLFRKFEQFHAPEIILPHQSIEKFVHFIEWFP